RPDRYLTVVAGGGELRLRARARHRERGGLPGAHREIGAGGAVAVVHGEARAIVLVHREHGARASVAVGDDEPPRLDLVGTGGDGGGDRAEEPGARERSDAQPSPPRDLTL